MEILGHSPARNVPGKATFDGSSYYGNQKNVVFNKEMPQKDHMYLLTNAALL